MASDREIAFPKLTADEIEALRPRGGTRDVAAGEVIFSEGDRGRGHLA